MKKQSVEVDNNCLSIREGRIKSNGRIAYLDALKTFAILLVIEGHVRILGMGISPYDSFSGLLFFSFELPIFFFVSGYLAFKESLSIKSACVNISNKFLLLVIPAVIFRTVLNVVENRDLLSPLFEGFGKYWFTITLFECFVIYYIILCLLKRNYLVFVAMILLSLLGVSLIGFAGNIGPRIIDLGHLTNYFYFFTIGILAHKFQVQYKKILKNQAIKAIAIILFFLSLLILEYYSLPKPVLHLLRDIVLRLIGTFLVVSLFASLEVFFYKTKAIMVVLREVGGRTLPIYLLQYFFIPNLNMIQERLLDYGMFTIHMVSFGLAFCIILVCMVFIYCLEQSDFIKKMIFGQK